MRYTTCTAGSVPLFAAEVHAGGDVVLWAMSYTSMYYGTRSLQEYIGATSTSKEERPTHAKWDIKGDILYVHIIYRQQHKPETTTTLPPVYSVLLVLLNIGVVGELPVYDPHPIEE